MFLFFSVKHPERAVVPHRARGRGHPTLRQRPGAISARIVGGIRGSQHAQVFHSHVSGPHCAGQSSKEYNGLRISGLNEHSGGRLR